MTTGTRNGSRGARAHRGRAPARRRHGSAYLAVVGVALASAAVCVGALTVVRSQTATSDAANDAADARLYALAAIEMGRYIPMKDVGWRSDYGNGQWVGKRTFDRGAFKLVATAAGGGNLAAGGPTDPVLLTATGYCGSAVQQAQATLSVNVTPLDCLQTAMTVNGNVSTSIYVTYAATSMTLATNGSWTATASSIKGQVEAVGTALTGTFTPAAHTGVAPRSLPSPTTVFDYYTANGASIPVTSLSGGTGSTVTVQYKLLTPTQDTFPTTGSGATNTSGIYVIDCGGKNVTIKDSRIVGTLVLLNTGNSSSVGGNVSWSPAVANYPCLLVKGPMAFAHTSANLAESSANLNPSGTPPAINGTNNTTVTAADTYLGGIRGLVYVSGAVTTSGTPLIGMLMGGGTLTSSSMNSVTTFSYDSTYYNNPPPGFGTVKVYATPGLWAQAASQ